MDILSKSKKVDTDLEPLTKKIYLVIEPPSLNNNQGDADRLKETILKQFPHLKDIYIPLQLLRSVPHICRYNNWKVTVTLYENGNYGHLIKIEPGQKTSHHWGIAADIGTTTIVAYLIDMKDGAIVDVESSYNQQLVFGEDILTRLQQAEDNGRLSALQNAIIDSLNIVINRLTNNNHLETGDISVISLSGNTTMVHFFLGINPSNIFHTPYIPAVNDPGTIDARDLRLNIDPFGIIYCIPSVGSYVGGDVVSGILVSELYKCKEISILVDIGTNGEIVLGNLDWMLACAGAAGPALEGGVVDIGMKAEEGAVANIKIIPETKQVEYKTIGDTKPKGICGSGLIDCIAELLLNGIIDRRGNFKDGDSYFVVVPANKTARNKDILITQNDIKNVIRTKGAVNAALEVILESVGCTLDDINNFYLAGAFGEYLNVESAITIGLYPDLQRDKFVHLGNSSVEGARLTLISKEKRSDIKKISSNITYIELNANQQFMNKYTSGLFLPHTNIAAFPTVRKKLIKYGIIKP